VQGTHGVNDWGGTRSPDIIGAVRVDQACGLGQILVAAHDIHAAYYGTTEVTGHPVDKWGGCVVDQEHPDRTWRQHQPAGCLHGWREYNFESLFPESFMVCNLRQPRMMRARPLGR
jgi:hypothetical protein